MLDTGSSDTLVDSCGIIAGTGVGRQGLSRIVIHVRSVSVSTVEKMKLKVYSRLLWREMKQIMRQSEI